MIALSLIGATAIDLALGDPRWLPHPVRWIGSLIAGLERFLFPVRRCARKEFVMGCMLSLSVIVVCAGLCSLVVLIAQRVSMTAVVAVEIILGFYCLSARSLADEAMKVYKKLREQDASGAQVALAMIVGRDTDTLSEKQIICAAVETVAENITDGIVSPLFYLALGGPVAAVVFKAVSTMDSMIGHKNERYRYFGTFAARLDDVLNFIPARLTGFILIPLASLLLRYRFRNALRMTVRDRLKHESPNSAHGESAMAGALGIQLGGGAFYKGVFISRPLLGDNSRDPALKDIKDASRIAIAVTLLILFVTCGIQFGFAKGRFF